jgi:hypothetical protein
MSAAGAAAAIRLELRLRDARRKVSRAPALAAAMRAPRQAGGAVPLDWRSGTARSRRGPQDRKENLEPRQRGLLEARHR